MTLPSVTERVQHAIDYAGAALLAVGLSAIVLLTTLGGTSYDWASAQIVGLGAIAVAGLVAFVRRGVARRRADPAAAPVPQPRLRASRARSGS